MSNFDILVNVRDSGSPQLANVAKNLDGLTASAKKADAQLKSAGAGFKSFTDKMDAAGREARIGLSALGSATRMVGLDISGITNVAAAAADSIGDITGALGNFSQMQALAVGGIGAFAVAAGLVVQKLQQQHDAMVASIKANDQFLQSIQKLAPASKEAAEAIDRIAQAQASWREMASSNPLTKIFGSIESAKIQFSDFFDGLDKGKVQFRSLGDIIHDTTVQLQLQYNLLDPMSSAYARLDNQIAAAREAQEKFAASLDNSAQAVQREMTAFQTANLVNARIPSVVDPANEALKRLAEEGMRKAQQAAQKLASALRGVVDAALKQTEVTDADMEASKLGKYVDKWDEFRRRLEAVATGTPAENFGADFVKNFKELGMSAEQAAQAFKDWSLFADPKNLHLIDMGAVIEDVKHQIDGMIGKANVMAAAMKEVWANLSPTQKAALASQGIEDVTDAVKQMTDPVGKTKDEVGGLVSKIGEIPKNVSTTFQALTKDARAAIDDYKKYLDDFISKYGEITTTFGMRTGGTGGGGAPPPSHNPPSNLFASGANFVVPPGYPNDSFHMGVTSGEHVQVTPKGATHNWGGITVVLPQVRDANSFVRELNKLMRSSASKAAMGV